MTTYSFFRKWVNDKMYWLKLKKPPCHPQSNEPLWIPRWTKPVKFNNNARPVELNNNDCVYDPAYSSLKINIFHTKNDD
jgi:hypothetical protein